MKNVTQVETDKLPKELSAIRIDQGVREFLGLIDHQLRLPEGQSGKTLQDYISIVESLVRQYRRAQISRGSNPAQVVLEQFVNWVLTDRLPNISSNTWRLYRAALRTVLEQIGGQSGAQAIEQMLAHPSGCAGRKTKHSGSKALKHADFLAIMNHTSSSSLPSVALASRLLFGCRMVGLRPNEWWTAVLGQHPDGPRLIVENAKYREDRACGTHRTILLKQFAGFQLDGVVELLATLNEIGALNEVDRDRVYSTARRALTRVCADLWPKRRVCFYSARHAAIADFKLVYSPAEIAALVGHRSPSSAGHHYARHRASNGRKLTPAFPLPVPSPENIALVLDERPSWSAELRRNANRSVPDNDSSTLTGFSSGRF